MSEDRTTDYLNKVKDYLGRRFSELRSKFVKNQLEKKNKERFVELGLEKGKLEVRHGTQFGEMKFIQEREI